jgi:predicted transcriptional regulator of viral defense system
MRTLCDTMAGIAARQHGRIANAQLIAAGVDRDRIKRWSAGGRLRRVHHGVHAVGHTAPSLHAELIAAVLACGDGAVVSHRSAGHALGVLRAPPSRPEVTVPTTAGRGRPGIVVHRVRALDARDTSTLHGIPLTTVPRVLLGLAPHLTAGDLARACHEAWIRHDLAPALVEACVARNPAKKGAANLAARSAPT